MRLGLITLLFASLAWAQEELPPPSPPPPPPPVEPLPADVPPPPRAEAPPPVDDTPVTPWRDTRKGFHWSVGGGGMVDPSGGSASSPSVVGFIALEPAASWGFGWVDIHVGAQVLGYFSPSTDAVFFALDPQLRVNFARWYSLGFGPYLGVSISPSVDFALGASFSPAIFKLGDRGQHEVAVWGAVPFLFAHTSASGITLMLATYSYVF